MRALMLIYISVLTVKYSVFSVLKSSDDDDDDEEAHGGSSKKSDSDDEAPAQRRETSSVDESATAKELFGDVDLSSSSDDDNAGSPKTELTADEIVGPRLYPDPDDEVKKISRNNSN